MSDSSFQQFILLPFYFGLLATTPEKCLLTTLEEVDARERIFVIFSDKCRCRTVKNVGNFLAVSPIYYNFAIDETKNNAI